MVVEIRQFLPFAVTKSNKIHPQTELTWFSVPVGAGVDHRFGLDHSPGNG